MTPVPKDPNFAFNRMAAYFKAGASPVLAIELGSLPVDQFHAAAMTTALQTINGVSSAGRSGVIGGSSSPAVSG